MEHQHPVGHLQLYLPSISQDHISGLMELYLVSVVCTLTFAIACSSFLICTELHTQQSFESSAIRCRVTQMLDDITILSRLPPLIQYTLAPFSSAEIEAG